MLAGPLASFAHCDSCENDKLCRLSVSTQNVPFPRAIWEWVEFRTGVRTGKRQPKLQLGEHHPANINSSVVLQLVVLNIFIIHIIYCIHAFSGWLFPNESFVGMCGHQQPVFTATLWTLLHTPRVEVKEEVKQEVKEEIKQESQVDTGRPAWKDGSPTPYAVFCFFCAHFFLMNCGHV